MKREELAGYLAGLPELRVPEEVSPGLWRLEIGSGWWQWVGTANGLTVTLVSTSATFAASVHGYVPRPGWVGIRLRHADGEWVWQAEAPLT